MKERINKIPDILIISLKRNKNFPNNRLPVLIYRSAVNLPKQKNRSSELLQKIFLSNNWSNTWKNGIYNFHHYHSITHECLGISMGSAFLILGGPGGKRVEVTAGDILILPAGVGHKCLKASKNFICIGAYPEGKDYDTNTGTPAEYKKAITKIRTLSIPQKDPVYGKKGFLKNYWKKTIKKQ